MKHVVHITYVCLIINTLLTILFGLAYCVYEVDLFLVVWMSSLLAVFAFPAGIGLSIYALIQKNDRRFRMVTLIWNMAIIALFGLVFYVLPSGSQRVVNGMERDYLSHHDAIRHLCRYATDTLLLPEGSAIVVTENGKLKTRKVTGRSFYMPTMVLTEDTLFELDDCQVQRLLQLHKAAKMGDMSVCQSDSSVVFRFVSRVFGTYWYAIPRQPYTEEDMLFQLNHDHYCPYSLEVCFLFDGGATGHEIPFPMKEYFLQSHGIDSLAIYHLFH